MVFHSELLVTVPGIEGGWLGVEERATWMSTWTSRRADWSHKILGCLQGMFRVSVSVVVQPLWVWWSEPNSTSCVAYFSSRVSSPGLGTKVSSGPLGSACHTPSPAGLLRGTHPFQGNSRAQPSPWKPASLTHFTHFSCLPGI